MTASTYAYNYDDFGNRSTAGGSGALSGLSTYSANNLNPYTSISNGQSAINSPTYDADGNLLTNGVWVYVWDAENRLASACSNGVLLVSNTYDHQSRRIKKEVSAFDSQTSAYSLQATASFLYDGWNPIRETISNQQSSSTNYYTWGLDLSGSLQGAGGVGGLLAVTSVISGGARPAIYFPCYDANGNVTGYLDTNGVPVAAVMYDAFGRKVSGTADAGLRLPYGFSTKYWDEETGLYYYGYRFYSPEMGRWMSRDPIGEVGGINYYACVQNNLVNMYDPAGLKGCSCGSDITESLDDALAAAERRFYAQDGLAGFIGRLRGCYTLFLNYNDGLRAWDLLYNSSATKGKKCRGSVTVKGGCHDRSEVNYALFGRGAKLCKVFFSAANAEILLYKNTWKAMENINNHNHPDGWFGTSDSVFEWTPQVTGWAKYGYDGTVPSAPKRLKSCKKTLDVGTVRIDKWPW